MKSGNSFKLDKLGLEVTTTPFNVKLLVDISSTVQAKVCAEADVTITRNDSTYTRHFATSVTVYRIDTDTVKQAKESAIGELKKALQDYVRKLLILEEAATEYDIQVEAILTQ